MIVTQLAFEALVMHADLSCERTRDELARRLDQWLAHHEIRWIMPVARPELREYRPSLVLVSYDPDDTWRDDDDHGPPAA